MPISPTNLTKTAISPSNTPRDGFYLLTELDEFLTTEDDFLFMLDSNNYGVDVTNVSKTSISPSNQSKN